MNKYLTKTNIILLVVFSLLLGTALYFSFRGSNGKKVETYSPVLVVNKGGKNILMIDGKEIDGYDSISNIKHIKKTGDWFFVGKKSDKQYLIKNGVELGSYDSINDLNILPGGAGIVFIAKVGDKYSVVKNGASSNSYNSIAGYIVSQDGKSITFLASNHKYGETPNYIAVKDGKEINTNATGNTINRMSYGKDNNLYFLQSNMNTRYNDYSLYYNDKLIGNYTGFSSISNRSSSGGHGVFGQSSSYSDLILPEYNTASYVQEEKDLNMISLNKDGKVFLFKDGIMSEGYDKLLTYGVNPEDNSFMLSVVKEGKPYLISNGKEIAMKDEVNGITYILDNDN